MINYIKNNIEFIIKLLIFLSAVFVITPLPFINGSLYFWFVVSVVIIFNLTLIFKDIKLYLKNYLWEMLFIISCLISSLINYRYNNIYSIVYIIFTAYLIFSMLPHGEISKEKYLKQSKILEYLIIVYSFVISLISFIQLLIFNNDSIIEIIIGGRFSGIYLNANQAAFWAFSSIIFSMRNFDDNKKFHILNMGLQSVLIVLSGCRSVYLALFIYVFLLLFNKNNASNVKKRLFWFLLAAIVVLLGVTLIRYNWFWKYFNIDQIEQMVNVLSGYRYFIWKEAWQVFLSNPLFGVGVNNMRFAGKEILGNNSYYILGNWEDPHNIVIALLAYTGIVGFVLFFKCIYNYFQFGIKEINKYNIIVITSLLSISLLDIGILFDDRILSVVFWYTVGIILFEKRYRGEKSEKIKAL